MNEDLQGTHVLTEFEQRNVILNNRLTALRTNAEQAEEPLQDQLVEVNQALDAAIEQLRTAETALRERELRVESLRMAARVQRERYEEVLEGSGVAQVLTNARGVILKANPETAGLLGTAEGDLIGRSLADVLIGEDRFQFSEWIQGLIRDGGERVGERRFTTSNGDGRNVPVLMKALMWNDEETGILRFSCLLKPDQEARRAQSETRPAGVKRLGAGDGPLNRRSEASKLLDLIHGVDAILWEAGSDGRLRFINRRAEEMLGYPADLWLNDPGFWTSIVHPEDREMVVSHHQRSIREGRGGELEYRVLAADGRRTWLRESVRVIEDGEGKTIGFRGLIFNVGRRKKVERQLYTSRRELSDQNSELSSLLDLGLHFWSVLEPGPLLEEILAAAASMMNASMGEVRLLDPAQNELRVAASQGMSPAYLERFGRVPVGVLPSGVAFEMQESVGVENVDALPEDDPVREAARTAGFRSCFQTRLVGSKGEALGTLALFFRLPHRPPTRQIRLVERFARHAGGFLQNARRHEAIRESDQRKDRAMGMLAHELRTAISAILYGASAMPQNCQNDPSIGETRDLILRQTRTMGRLVEDLFDATRLTRGENPLRFKKLDLSRALSEAAGTVRLLIEERRHELIVTGPTKPVSIEADPTRLEQILANLLTNAARYTEPGGQITLAGWSEGDQVVIRVRDTGQGISPEMRERIFEPYMREGTEDEVGRQPEGLGLGLTLVKGLVEQHGGRIEVSSRGRGQGSEFLIHLPAKQPVSRPELVSTA